MGRSQSLDTFLSFKALQGLPSAAQAASTWGCCLLGLAKRLPLCPGVPWEGRLSAKDKGPPQTMWGLEADGPTMARVMLPERALSPHHIGPLWLSTWATSH